MRVFKFGGSCLTGRESLARVAEILRDAGPPVICVLSAVKGMTDRLYGLADKARTQAVDPEPLIAEHFALIQGLGASRCAHAEEGLERLAVSLRRTLKGIEYLGEASPRSLDRIASFGERAAVVIAEALLQEAGVPAKACPDADPGFLTDGVHQDARIRPERDEELKARYASRQTVHVVPGFCGRGPDGAITTLGRGGSDYTATYLGAVLGATTTLWKDTAGLMTADPGVVQNARRIDHIHYLDALELAHYGMEAIADKAIVPAMDAQTAIEIRSFRNPSIVTRVDGEEAKALAITCVRRAAMIEFFGRRGNMLRTLGRLFRGLADMQIYPLLVTEASPRGETTMVLKESELPRMKRFLAEVDLGGERPEIQTDLGVVSLIGGHMRRRVGMAAAIFECLAREKVNIVSIAQTASERNVSVAVIRDAVEPAVRALHARFIDQS